MKKIIILFFAFWFLSAKENGQLTKGNWMVGGNVEFSAQKTNFPTGSVSGIRLSFNPKVGYFLFSHLVSGLFIDYGYTVTESNNIKSHYSNIGIGPFIRYYFLPGQQRINILAETSLGFNNTKNNQNDKSNFLFYSALVGPTIFFNTSAAIELLMGYRGYKEKQNDSKIDGIHFNIGFQIFLEKE